MEIGSASSSDPEAYAVRVRHDHEVAAAQMPLDAITQGDPAIALRNDARRGSATTTPGLILRLVGPSA